MQSGRDQRRTAGTRGLLEQLGYLFFLRLQPGQSDLLSTDRACVLLVDPLRDADLVEEVRLARQHDHDPGILLADTELVVDDPVAFRSLVEIFHANATTVKHGRVVQTSAFVRVLHCQMGRGVVILRRGSADTTPRCGCMPVIHGPQRAELVNFDPGQVFDYIVGVLRWCRPVFVPADKQQGPTNDDEEHDGEEAQRAHVKQNDHVDEELEDAGSIGLALLARVVLSQDYPGPDRQQEVAAFKAVCDGNRSLRLKVLLKLRVRVPNHENEGHAGPQAIDRVPRSQRLLAWAFVLDKADEPSTDGEHVHEAEKDRVGDLPLRFLLGEHVGAQWGEPSLPLQHVYRDFSIRDSVCNGLMLGILGLVGWVISVLDFFVAAVRVVQWNDSASSRLWVVHQWLINCRVFVC